jgi:hypothetical protein
MKEVSSMFLCSHCKTEQSISGIEYKGLKFCLCPNCGQVCCEDYCQFSGNGRWNRIDPGWFHDDEVNDAFSKALAAYNAASTERAKINAEIVLKAADKARDEARERESIAWGKAVGAFEERYEQAKKEYGIA